MTPRECNDTILTPALGLLPPHMSSPRARIMLLAIGLQESRLKHRVQIGGPAHGLWQFECGGGVVGVLSHKATWPHAKYVCEKLGVPALAGEVYRALPVNDVLAAAFARLLLFSDPRPLPLDEQEGWDCYLRTWRPGKPHALTWADHWAQALATLHATP